MAWSYCPSLKIHGSTLWRTLLYRRQVLYHYVSSFFYLFLPYEALCLVVSLMRINVGCACNSYIFSPLHSMFIDFKSLTFKQTHSRLQSYQLLSQPKTQSKAITSQRCNATIIVVIVICSQNFIQLLTSHTLCQERQDYKSNNVLKTNQRNICLGLPYLASLWRGGRW